MMKNFLIIIFTLLISSAGAYYLYYSDNEVKEIPTLSPEKTNFKFKPEQEKVLVGNNTGRLLYENLISKENKNKNENFVPEPEDPILLDRKNKDSDIFEAENLNKDISAEKNPDNIWGDAQNAGSEEKQEEIEKTKTLQVKQIVDKKPVKDILAKKLSASFYVQLAYLRSENEVKVELAKIKQKNKKLMADKKYKILKEKKNSTIYYQLLEGPYDDFKDAKLTCKKVKLDGNKCIVVKK